MSSVQSPIQIGGLSVHLHHQAPADQPGFGVGVRRHDGPGGRARFDHGGVGLHRRPGSSATGINLTAAQIGGTVTGELDATGCDIGVYNPTRVTSADIHGARYYGVVVNGGTVNTTNSKIHQIGEKPVRRHAARPRHPLHQRRERHDQRQQGLRLPEERDRGPRPDRRRQRSLQRQDLRDGREQRRHRPRVPSSYIAQNGIVVLGNASATVKDNTVSDLRYTRPGGHLRDWPAELDARKVTVSGNKFVDTEVRIDGAVTANVLGNWTTVVRPHGIRVDLRSYEQARPPGDARHQARLEDQGRRQDQAAHQAGLRRPRRVLRELQGRLGPARGQDLQERPPRPHAHRPRLIHTSNTQEALAHFGPGLLPVYHPSAGVRPSP